MRYEEYDVEAAFDRDIKNLSEADLERRLREGRAWPYVIKEIRAGDQLEVEIYPEFTKKELPGSRRRPNREAMKNLNDKNRRKKLERIINANFKDGDLWCTFTYDDEHLPETFEDALKEMQRFIKRINYRRKKKNLPNARYIYITEHDPKAKIRWHHHMVMDAGLSRDLVEDCWKAGGRNQIRRMKADEEGFSGMANYITKVKKDRPDYRKSWNASRGLKQPEEKKRHYKRKGPKGSYRPIKSFVKEMIQDREAIRDRLEAWYPDMTFTRAEAHYNAVNSLFYIYGKMRRKRWSPG